MILQEFSEILYQQNEIKNILERAVYLHLNLAKLQPFIDGNKRTARMAESIILMNNNIVPVFSTNDEDFVKYREGIVHFYETGDYSKYSDFFLKQKIDYLQRFTNRNLLKQNGINI